MSNSKHFSLMSLVLYSYRTLSPKSLKIAGVVELSGMGSRVSGAWGILVKGSTGFRLGGRILALRV